MRSWLMAALVAALFMGGGPSATYAGMQDRAGAGPYALVVHVRMRAAPEVEAYRTLTDVAAPVNSAAGPFRRLVGCTVAAATRVPRFMGQSLPGWEVEKAYCVPVGRLEMFLAAHEGPRI